MTGIDRGVHHFLTTAGGGHEPNPRRGKRTADALADAQRAVTALPRVWAGQPNRPASPCGGAGRHAASHDPAASGGITVRKTALAIVSEYDVIAHERLSIANMVRAPQPQPDPGVVPLRLDIIDPETTVKKGQPVSVHISSRRPGKPYCRRSGKLAAWTEENLPT